MLFDDLTNNKKMSDPAQRKTEELKRSEKPSKIKVKSSSVDINTYKRNTLIIGIISTVIILLTVGYLIYQGIKTFVGV